MIVLKEYPFNYALDELRGMSTNHLAVIYERWQMVAAPETMRRMYAAHEESLAKGDKHLNPGEPYRLSLGG